MPNYGLVINSKFKPFSYQEMLAPVNDSTVAHQALENAYNELDVQAGVWDNLLNKELDKNSYERYKNYADALNEQASILASEGLNPSSRQAIAKLKSRYAKDIAPIEKAYTKREEDIKLQQAAVMNNPALEISRDARTTSLDKYIENKDIGFSIIDKNKVMQDVYTQAVALSKEYVSDPEKLGQLKKLIGGNYFEYVKQRGFSSEAVLSAILNKNNPVLNALVDNAVNATGVNDSKIWSQDVKDRVTAAAYQGLWGAVGSQEAQILNNWRAQQAQQHANRMAEIQETNRGKENSTNNIYEYTQDEKTYKFNPKEGVWYREEVDASGNVRKIMEVPKNAPAQIRKGDSGTAKSIDENFDISNEGYSAKAVIIKGDKSNNYKVYGHSEDLEGGSNNSLLTRDKGLFDRDNASFTLDPDKAKDMGKPFNTLSPDDIYGLSEEIKEQIYKVLGIEGEEFWENMDKGTGRYRVRRVTRLNNDGDDYIVYRKY
jgi:hypothetical protein